MIEITVFAGGALVGVILLLLYWIVRLEREVGYLRMRSEVYEQIAHDLERVCRLQQQELNAVTDVHANLLSEKQVVQLDA